ncbi:sensor histidine kinase [Gluconobacter japonicus]|uniref:sensor histidine kinase n=1 Tax=Gluconobacter japonicus TaxID=376620 RepID=UPI0007809424|nr:ATP-binding protein [Gluconobacter japonicus]KXV24129.1 histidine kinase [Gluconobacter japonicus]
MRAESLAVLPHDGLPLWVGLTFAGLAVAGWASAALAFRHRSIPQPVMPEYPASGLSLSLPDAPLPIEFFPGSVLLLDRLGAVLQANEEAVTQFGDSVGAILRHPAARSALSAALRAEPEGADDLPPVCSTTFTLDVPVPRTLHLSLRGIPASQERHKRVLVVLSDRSEAQVLDRMRLDFVAHASHELRTPLASLSGFIDALRTGGSTMDEGTRQQFLDIMGQQSARLKRLIDRLLYLSRVQAHEHQRPRDVVDVADLMAIVLGEVAPRFDEDGCTLNLALEDDLIIKADEDEMVQVLLNLIENALKYGRERGRDFSVTLFARRAPERDDRWPEDGGILLGVEDNGRGMEAHHLPRLTERFYRVVDNVEPAQQGTGLGLSIVRHILDRHGGRLRVASAPGRGTTCLVWLPPVSVVQPEMV